jgi:glycosyltransferase involved in cell wall biosynthesis
MEKHKSEQLQNAEIPEFSVIITCHYEERSIEEFHSKLSAALDGLGRTCEIIMVNDGSTDKTFEALKRIYEKDPKVTVIADLFKNSGQAAAVTAGIKWARGKNFILMDSDLQLNPDELPLLLTEFDKGNDLVSGYRKNRKDSVFRIIPSKIANIIMRKVSESDFTDFGCTFKIINGKLIRAFDLGPYKIFHMPMIISKAQRCVEVPVTHYLRKYGKSGWTFKKLFAYNMDNIVCLSQRPFQVLGTLCFGFALLFILRIVMVKVFDFSVIQEVTNGLILNAIAITALIITSILCLIGEFAIRNFVSTQNNPTYIIREVLQKK